MAAWPERTYGEICAAIADATEEAQVAEYERLMAEADEIIANIRRGKPLAKVPGRRRPVDLPIDLDRWVDAHKANSK